MSERHLFDPTPELPRIYRVLAAAGQKTVGAVYAQPLST
jgi:hypothetical protein